MKKITITNLEELNGIDSKNYFVLFDSRKGAVVVMRKDDELPYASFSASTPKKTLINSLSAFGINVNIVAKKKKKEVAPAKKYNVVVGGINRELTLNQVRDLEKVLGEEIEIVGKPNFKKETETPKTYKVDINGVVKELTEQEFKELEKVMNGSLSGLFEEEVVKTETKVGECAKKKEVNRLAELVKSGNATNAELKSFLELQGFNVGGMQFVNLDTLRKNEEVAKKEEAEKKAEIKELACIINSGKGTPDQIRRFCALKGIKIVDFGYKL